MLRTTNLILEAMPPPTSQNLSTPLERITVLYHQGMWLELPIIAMNSIKRCMNTFAAKSLYTMLKFWQHETGYLYVPLHWYEVEEWHKTWSHSGPKLKLHTRSSVWTKNLIITMWGESSKYLEWEQLLGMGSLVIERIFWSTSSDSKYWVAAGWA